MLVQSKMADSAGDNKTLSEKPENEPPKPQEEKKEEKKEEEVTPTPAAESTDTPAEKDEKTPEAEQKETPMEVEESKPDETKAEIPAPTPESTAEVKAEPKVEPEKTEVPPATDGSGESTDDSTTAPEKQDEAAKEKPAEEYDCYCGQPRNLGVPEFMCGMCMRFCHAACLTCHTGKVVQFMTNYSFFCKRCNMSGQETFNKKQSNFGQMCVTAIANLMYKNPEQRLFSKDKDIIPYIEKYWEHLTTTPRRIKMTWHTTIQKTMLKEYDIFIADESTFDPRFGLLLEDLEKLSPTYEAMFKAPAASYKGEQLMSSKDVPLQTKTRGTKRKNPEGYQNAFGLKPKKGEVLSTKITPQGYPTEHPQNKDGYRYILAEPDPHAPNRDAFDASLDWAGKPIPGFLYRTWLDSNVLLALHDRAPQLKISDDRLTLLTGEKGYCMVRSTHGINRGSWYFEVTITSMPEGTATRIGWAQQLGNLQAPCGYDKFSYSWRSRKGTTFHQSRGKHYAEDSYEENDVLGFYISLPLPEDPKNLLPPTSKNKPLVKFKSHLYFEEKDFVSEVEKTLIPAKGSKMVMYKNGVNQGVAFEDLFEGWYYPAVSVYKSAAVAMNFGPDFKYPPKDQGDWKPISDQAQESIVEHALADIMYHLEHEGQQPEF